jgi:hypothetical protein
MKENKNRNTSMKLFSVLIYVTILAIVGMFKIFVFDTDISAVGTWDFWIEQSITSVMYFSAYLATANLRYSTAEFKEAEYVEIESAIRKYRPKLIGSTFRCHIELLDMNSKKATWKNKIETELSNHLKKTSKKVAIELVNKKEEEWSSSTRRFIRKEKMLNEYLTDGWINKNLRFRPLKYPEITVSEIINGTLRMSTSGSMLERNHLGNQIKRRFIFVFASIVASAIWAVLIFREVLNPLDVIAQIIFTLAMLLVNIIFGYIAAGFAHRSRIVAATERLEIIINYIKMNKIDIEKE